MTNALPEDSEKRRFVERMFDGIASRYDLMNRLMTFGIDRGWRRAALAALDIDSTSTVLDLGCGTGDLSRGAAACGARVLGIDLSAAMLRLAADADRDSTYIRSDASVLPVRDASVDGVISGFAVRNFISFDDVVRDCARVLKPGGRVVWLEVDVPRTRAMRAGFDLYFKHVMPRIGGLVSSGYAYSYLADSLAYLPDDERFRRLHESAGFERVEKIRLTAGAAQLVTAVRKCPSAVAVSDAEPDASREGGARIAG
jgi:demethylmenaquinone methyltransferase/2-methoxy-6-polyprenyl-1,4-benzoquinol methylase